MAEGAIPFLVQFSEISRVLPAHVYEQDNIGMLHVAGSAMPAIADIRSSMVGLNTILTKAYPDQPDPDLVRGFHGRRTSLMSELVTEVVTVAPDPDVLRFDPVTRADGPLS